MRVCPLNLCGVKVFDDAGTSVFNGVWRMARVRGGGYKREKTRVLFIMEDKTVVYGIIGTESRVSDYRG